MKKKIICIYCIENKTNKKKYIGQTRDFERRKNDHIKYYFHENNEYLKKSIEKHGIDNFVFYILEECFIEELNEKGIFYIGLYQTTNRDFGYNIMTGGNVPPNFKGRKHSDKTKLKMSEKAKGNKHWLGKHHSEETRKKKSELVRGEKHYFFGKKRPNASSKYFGVSRHIDKRTNKITWRAKLCVNGKVIQIGSSIDEKTSAKLYDQYIKDNNLPHPINFEEK